MTRPASPPSPPTAGAGVWDLSFLRVGTLATAAAALLALPVAGLLVGWPGFTGVLVGATVVTVFFSLSGWTVAWAGRTFGDTATLPAALLLFGVKALLLLAVLQSLPAQGWTDRVVVAWAVVVGALLWSVVQLRWVWTRQLYYVTPPAPPR